MNENFHHQHQADSTSKPPAVFSQQSYLSHSIKRNEAPLPVPGESNHFESNSTSHAYNEETIHKTILVGDSGVGKTSILVQFDQGKFQSGSFSATVGIGFTKHHNKCNITDYFKHQIATWLSKRVCKTISILVSKSC